MADLSVSVVVPVRNGANFLGEALESALAQSLPPEEVIVVDDGSADGSADIARAFSARVIPNDGHGVSAARNAGIVASRGEVIALLDHDDLWEPHKLERQVAYLAARPELSFVWSRVRVLVEAGVERPEWVQEEFVTGPGHRAAATSSLVVRREAFAQIGWFATNLAEAEDLDWILRARDAGMKSAMVDEVLARYRIHGTNTTLVNPRNPASYLSVLHSSVARRRHAAGGSIDAG